MIGTGREGSGRLVGAMERMSWMELTEGSGVEAGNDKPETKKGHRGTPMRKSVSGRAVEMRLKRSEWKDRLYNFDMM